MMTNKQKIQQILDYLDEIFPNVGCELNYQKDYELVIAVMLSAQTTDASVNAATAHLFLHYPTLESLANAKLEDIENEIHSIGLYKNKAKNIIGIAQTLLEKFDGVIPTDKNLLQELPGIGNKSAGVVRAEHGEPVPALAQGGQLLHGADEEAPEGAPQRADLRARSRLPAPSRRH